MKERTNKFMWEGMNGKWMIEWTNEEENEYMNEQTNEEENESTNERSERRKEWIRKRMKERTSKWMREGRNGGINEQTNEWTNKQMNKWMNERTIEWMNERIRCRTVNISRRPMLAITTIADSQSTHSELFSYVKRIQMILDVGVDRKIEIIGWAFARRWRQNRRRWV